MAPLQYILEAEDHRRSNDPHLLRFINSGDVRVAVAAIRAFGRIGDPSGLTTMNSLFNKRRTPLEIKLAIAEAFGLIAGRFAINLIGQNIEMQGNPQLKAQLIVSLGRAKEEPQAQGKKDERVVEKLQETFLNLLLPRPPERRGDAPDEPDARILSSACHGLGLLWTNYRKDWKFPQGLVERVVNISKRSDDVSLSCSFALARFKGDPTLLPLEDLILATQLSNGATRALLIRALARVKNPRVSQLLCQFIGQTTHAAVKIEAIKGLANQESSGDITIALMRSLSDMNSSVLVTALETIRSKPDSALVGTVDQVYLKTSSSWVKGVALQTLAILDSGKARGYAQALLSSGPIYYPAIFSTWASLKTNEDVEKIESFLVHTDNKVVAAAASALSEVSVDKVSANAKSLLVKALERKDVAITSSIAEQVERRISVDQALSWRDLIPHLLQVYRQSNPVTEQLEARVQIIRAVSTLRAKEHLPFLYEALLDKQRPIAEAAAQAIKVLTDEDVSSRVPLNSEVTSVTPSLEEVMRATAARILLKTSRGNILLEMCSEAPLTAYHFVKLVSNRFYDGLTFHRVVPNFVVQGGDPRGDGYGGPGYFIRDEASSRVHEKGTVGIATAGKDTGGSQFFINTAHNLHLDGRYTMFARVIAGMDVADRLEIGDKILSASVLK